MSIPRDSDLTVNQYLSRKDVDIKRGLKKSMELTERIPDVFQKSELSLECQINHLFLNRILLDGRLSTANKFRHIYEKPIVGGAEDNESYKAFKFLLNDFNWSQRNISVTLSGSDSIYMDMNDATSTTSQIVNDFISYSVPITSYEPTEIRVNVSDSYVDRHMIDQGEMYYKLNFTSSVNPSNIILTQSSDNPNREMCKRMNKVSDHLFESEFKPGENYGRYYSNGKYLPIPWINREINYWKKLKARHLPWNPELNITDFICRGYLHGKRYLGYTDFYSIIYPDKDNYRRIPWNTHIPSIQPMKLSRYKLREKSGRKEHTLHGILTYRSYGIKHDTLKDDRMKDFIKNFSKVPWYPDMLQIFDIRNKIQFPDEESDASLINTINQDIIELNSIGSN